MGVKQDRIVILLILALLLNSRLSFAQTIQVASVHYDRFDAGTTDKGYTLNGDKMRDHALLKLTNPNNFGPTGIVPYTLNITHTFLTTGSITTASLASVQILFIGSYFGSLYPFTDAEKAAIAEWAIKPGNVLIVAEQAANYPVTSHFGYQLLNGNVNPSRAKAGGDKPELFSGIFGNSNIINQEGTSQGYFTTNCFSTVIAQNASNNPTIIFHSKSRDIFIADTDFFTNLSIGGVSYGGNILNESDIVWANLWAWAANEAVNPSNSTVPIMASTTNACNGNDGSVSFTSPIGTSSNGETYEYSIDGLSFQSNPTFSGLSENTYKIYAKTATCPITEGDEVIVKGPLPKPKGVADQLQCGQANTSINLSDLPSAGNYTINRQPGGVIATNVSGVTYTDNSVIAGSYTYTITDASTCTSLPSEVIKVEIAGGFGIDNISLVHATCDKDNGSLQVIATGGASPIQYSIDNVSFQLSNEFRDLKAGNYTVVIKDANTCTDNNSVEIKTTILPTINNIDTKDADCEESNGRIDIDASGEGVLTYSKDGISYINTPFFDGLSAGTYSIIVKDENACEVEKIVGVLSNCITIHMSNAFTPNNDNLNNDFRIFFKGSDLQVNHLKVYNRWGDMIFAKDNFKVISGDPIWEAEGIGGFEAEAIVVLKIWVENLKEPLVRPIVILR